MHTWGYIVMSKHVCVKRIYRAPWTVCVSCYFSLWIFNKHYCCYFWMCRPFSLLFMGLVADLGRHHPDSHSSTWHPTDSLGAVCTQLFFFPRPSFLFHHILRGSRAISFIPVQLRFHCQSHNLNRSWPAGWKAHRTQHRNRLRMSMEPESESEIKSQVLGCPQNRNRRDIFQWGH